jgi:hypothetical protein
MKIKNIIKLKHLIMNNELMKIIVFIILCIIIIFKTKIKIKIIIQNSNDLEINKIYFDANLSYEQAKGEFPGYNNLQLNYQNECSKYFKYKKNTKRDIVIFAYTYRPEKEFFQVFDSIIDSFKHSIPRAIIATIIPQRDMNSEGAKLLKRYEIKLIPFEGYEEFNIVTSRYIAIYDFLKKNANKYKRIFLSDIDDVYILRDIFSTFNEDEIIINKQCFQFESENCNQLFPIDERWYNESYIIDSNNTEKDLELIKDIGINKINPQVINGGIIFGGIKKVIKFLKIFNEYINPNKGKYFGYDQVLITLLVSKKKFDSIGLKLEQCTQRVCFMPDVKYNINTTKIIYKQNMCSPIVLHKNIPINWKTHNS